MPSIVDFSNFQKVINLDRVLMVSRCVCVFLARERLPTGFPGGLHVLQLFAGQAHMLAFFLFCMDLNVVSQSVFSSSLSPALPGGVRVVAVSSRFRGWL